MTKKDKYKLAIDHVGILGPSIDELASTYRQLGFNVTEPIELVSVDEAGELTTLGQQSAHIMFPGCYLELTAVSRPTPNHHLGPFLDGPFGLRLLFLSARNIIASRDNCISHGLLPIPVQTAAREITYGTGGLARFHWFALPFDDFPEALVGYVEHKTPDIVFQDRVVDQPNGAYAFSRLIIGGNNVPKSYCSLETCDSDTSLEAWSNDQFMTNFAVDVTNSPPFVAVGLRVEDLGKTEKLLLDNGIDCHAGVQSIAVNPSDAGGVGLLFEAVA